MSLARFAVRNSILAWMLTAIVLVGGGLTAVHLMPREVFPVTDLDLIVVRTLYPDASPDEVELQITAPIEDGIREVSDIQEFTSSSAEGVSVVVVKIDPDARDKSRVISDVQRRIDRIDDFPADAEDPVIEVVTTDQPVINIALSGGASEHELRRYGDELETALKNLPGVSTVTRGGWREEEFRVEADPARLDANEVSLAQVLAAVAAHNVSLPGGKVVRGDREILLRTVGKFRNAADIEAVVVRSNLDGRSVRVGDVATVRRAYDVDAPYLRANGARALLLGVKKREKGDTIEVAEAVKALVAREQARLGDALELTLVDDTSYYVKRRLNVLLYNGMYGLAFVLLCLFLVLRPGVASFTALGIPFSFLLALLAMAYFGVTINLMTMFGLIIVLGMVVDDSIIVGENIHRHLLLGKEPRAAAIDGADEVAGPVLATVLTTVAAFFPLLFAPDLYATYLGWLVIAVILALGASLLECVLVLPSHIADMARAFPSRPVAGRAVRGGRVSGLAAAVRMAKDAVGDALARGYARALRRAVAWRYAFVAGLAVVGVAATAALLPFARVILFPGDMIDIVFVYMEAADGTSLAAMESRVAAVEERIAALPADELQDVVTYMGQHLSFEAGMLQDRASHLAQTIVYLTPQNMRKRPTRDIVDVLRASCADVPGFERLSFELVKPGPPVGRPVEVRVQGPDVATLRTIAGELRDFLGREPGVRDVVDDFGAGKEERHVIVDAASAARLGVDEMTVARSVFAAFGGAEATTVREGRYELPVRVTLVAPQRDDDAFAPHLGLPNRAGRIIPLGSVASVRVEQGLPALHHFNGERTITVGADLDDTIVTSSELSARLQAAFADLSDRHPGYRLEPAGEWKETRKVLRFMQVALVIALLAIYAILAVQFGSFLQPFVLLFPIPLSFVGVLLALVLHQKPISIMAMLGFVGLGGVVVNDAIVLVSFINRLRREGRSVDEAIQEGGELRLRAILLTSVTTVVGLLPVIYGIGGYEPFIAPSAIVLAYGLVFSTYLTLLMVPCLYRIGWDVRQAVRRLRPRSA